MSHPSCSYYCSSILELEIRDGMPPEFLLLNRIVCFCNPEDFVIPYELKDCSFGVYEEFCHDFDEDCIECVDCF